MAAGLTGVKALAGGDEYLCPHRAAEASRIPSSLMFMSHTHRGVVPLAPMTPRDVDLLLDQARNLQRAAGVGSGRRLLKGKNLGLLCEQDESAAATLFRCAATDLGARVSHIRPSLTEASPAADVMHTGRLLGRLYDAVECQGIAPTLVEQLGVAAGVPVYDGIATAVHPSATLAELLGPATDAMENRRFVLQALLLNTIG
jgi:ornithine carbamoyltransferase